MRLFVEHQKKVEMFFCAFPTFKTFILATAGTRTKFNEVGRKKALSVDKKQQHFVY